MADAKFLLLAGATVATTALVVGGVGYYGVRRYRAIKTIHDSLDIVSAVEADLTTEAERVKHIPVDDDIVLDPSDLLIKAERAETGICITLRLNGVVATICCLQANWAEERTFLVLKLTRMFKQVLVQHGGPVAIDRLVVKAIGHNLAILLATS